MRNKRKYKYKQIILIIVILMCVLPLGIIFGRYATKNINDFFLKSKEFYFNSDKLSENGSQYQIDNWDGVSDYIMTINLNSRKNNLKAATYDIGYKINYRVTGNAICQLTKTEGTIFASSNQDFFNIIITPNIGMKNGDKVEVEIEATSTTGYTKTIKGKLTLIVGQEETTWKIEDSIDMPYMEFKITNTKSYYLVDEPFDAYTVNDRINEDTYLNLTEANKRKCHSAIVKVEFNPNYVLLDLTNELYNKALATTKTDINGNIFINGITIKVDALSSTSVRFYKKGEKKDYTYPNGTIGTPILKVTVK